MSKLINCFRSIILGGSLLFNVSSADCAKVKPDPCPLPEFCSSRKTDNSKRETRPVLPRAVIDEIRSKAVETPIEELGKDLFERLKQHEMQVGNSLGRSNRKTIALRSIRWLGFVTAIGTRLGLAGVPPMFRSQPPVRIEDAEIPVKKIPELSDN